MEKSQDENDYMSDSSEEPTEIETEDVYETVTKKGIDRKTTKQIKVLKAKPIPIPKKNTKKKINKEIEEEVLEEFVNEIVDEQEDKNKKITEKRLANLTKAREIKSNNQTVKRSTVKSIKRMVKKEMPLHTIEKTKVIYMIPTSNGFIESDTVPRLSKKELQFLDNDEIVSKKEIAIGKKIVRNKNGTERQKLTGEKLEKARAQGHKLQEVLKKKRADKKSEKAAELGKEIKKSLIEVVSKPLEESKKELLPPVQQQYDFSSMANNFTNF